MPENRLFLVFKIKLEAPDGKMSNPLRRRVGTFLGVSPF
jgi:hypothetical protein